MQETFDPWEYIYKRVFYISLEVEKNIIDEATRGSLPFRSHVNSIMLELAMFSR